MIKIGKILFEIFEKMLGGDLLFVSSVYPGCKNNKIQRKFELWDQENYFVISGFCYISVLYNESPLYTCTSLYNL